MTHSYEGKAFSEIPKDYAEFQEIKDKKATEKFIAVMAVVFGLAVVYFILVVWLGWR